MKFLKSLFKVNRDREERRQFPRIECPKDKTCLVTSSKKEEFQGALKNMSRAGATLVSKNRLSDEDTVDIVIKYPEIEREIPSLVQVIWRRFENDIYTYGTKFLSIHNEDKYDLLDCFYENWKKQILSKKD